MCEHLRTCPCGCTTMWLHDYVAARLHGCAAVRLCGCTAARLHSCMCAYIYVYMAACVARIEVVCNLLTINTIVKKVIGTEMAIGRWQLDLL